MEQTSQHKDQEKPNKKAANVLWPVVWLIGLLCLIITAYNPYIQYDESYTLSLIRHPVHELIRITGQDVHPPFYYLLVKAFSAPFGNSMWAVRAFNLLPLAGMFVLGKTLVRRLWGERTGLVFSLLSIWLPANMSYLLPEMRMYGLASFLELSAFLAGYILLKKRWEVLPERQAWGVLFTAGLMAAYTQYYALIGVALIYLWVGGSLLYASHGKLQRDSQCEVSSGAGKAAPAQKDKRVWRWCLCAASSALLYLPWLFVLMAQFGEVKEDYWIAPITLRNCVSYILFPVYSSLPVQAGLMLTAAVLVILLWDVWQRRKTAEAEADIKKKKAFYKPGYDLYVYGLFVYCGVILTGVLVSVLVSPVFSVRYVKCGLGIFTLCVACLAAGIRRTGGRLLLAAFGLFALCNLVMIASKNQQNFAAYEQMQDYAQEHFTEDAVLAFEVDGHYMGIFSYWFLEYKSVLPDEYWKDEYEAFAPQLMPRSAYEADYGRLEEQDFWVVDIGNVWWHGEWDGQQWYSVEHCEPFVFCDQTDSLQCMFAHLAGNEPE